MHHKVKMGLQNMKVPFAFYTGFFTGLSTFSFAQQFKLLFTKQALDQFSWRRLNAVKFIVCLCILFGNAEAQKPLKADYFNWGLYGYLGYKVSPNPAYGMGVSFYTAAWKLVDQPIESLQIGLPGTWIMPNNLDNDSTVFCPPGTEIRSVEAFGPTYSRVFQTLEGGLGYWARNKYRYGPPKFSMNATPQCYDYEVASPGWSFFYDDKALLDSLIGVAQLSNRLLIPPDALTFEGDPNGEFMGYSYMALPFTDAHHDSKVPVGNQSWTCFINTKNFKGPIAFYIPETWAKFSAIYPEVVGLGLDARVGVISSGAMEIGNAPTFRQYDGDSTLYVKIPKINFPVDAQGKTSLVQDLRYYNKDALWNDILAWRNSDIPASGRFNSSGMFKPEMDSAFYSLTINDIKIQSLGSSFKPFVNDSTFGFSWKDAASNSGSFPEYYKKVGDQMVPIQASDVPKNLGLVEAEFPIQLNAGGYSSPQKGSWTTPGSAKGPYIASLNDGSVVTYYWYRFIDQPAFGQFKWPAEKRMALQSLVEKIHAAWPINREYIPDPTFGELVSLDKNLIVTPPKGLEIGYVPIAVKQTAKKSNKK
ncbi:MAG: hypothetical protein ACK5RG_02350 [Cyclobacteriaceae bacterium]|jgi:hypothetical protein